MSHQYFLKHWDVLLVVLAPKVLFSTGGNNPCQTQELIVAGSINAPLVRKGYCHDLWPIWHPIPCSKSPNQEVLLYLYKFALSWQGGLYHRSPILFPNILCSGCKAKDRPNWRTWPYAQALPGGPSVWKSQAKLRESPGGMVATVSSEVRTKMAENLTQDGRFKGQFEKMEVLQFFLQLNQAFSF